MSNEQLILDNLMQINQEIGGFGARLDNIENDINCIKKQTNLSIIVPINKKQIIVAIVGVFTTALGVMGYNNAI